MGKKGDVSKLELESLNGAIDEFQRNEKRLDESVQTALISGTPDPLIADQINRGMMTVERNWLIPGGIPGRPWYKHALYACRQTYAHLELPGLTEAVEDGDVPLAQRQAAILEVALRNNAELVNELDRSLACGGNLTRQDEPLCSAH